MLTLGFCFVCMVRMVSLYLPEPSFGVCYMSLTKETRKLQFYRFRSFTKHQGA